LVVVAFGATPTGGRVVRGGWLLFGLGLVVDGGWVGRVGRVEGGRVPNGLIVMVGRWRGGRVCGGESSRTGSGFGFSTTTGGGVGAGGM
jgi:hypothetical protein